MCVLLFLLLLVVVVGGGVIVVALDVVVVIARGRLRGPFLISFGVHFGRAFGARSLT